MRMHRKILEAIHEKEFSVKPEFQNPGQPAVHLNDIHAAFIANGWEMMSMGEYFRTYALPHTMIMAQVNFEANGTVQDSIYTTKAHTWTQFIDPTIAAITEFSKKHKDPGVTK